MDVELDQCLFRDVGRFEAQFRNATSGCSLTGDLGMDLVALSTEYDRCGTRTSELGGRITFTQNLRVETFSGFLSLGRPADVEFTCFFDNNLEVNSNSTISTVDSSTGSAGSGDFAFDMTIYANDRFNAVMDESSVIGERVYVSIDGSSMPSTVVYAVESCTVRNEAFGLEIPVVTGKCGESLLATDFHTAGPYSA